MVCMYLYGVLIGVWNFFTEFMHEYQYYLFDMSQQMNPEKHTSNMHRLNTLHSKTSHENTTFADKMKEIRSIIASIAPEDKQKELLAHLQELNEAYQIEIHQEKIRKMNGKISEYETKNQSDLTNDKPRTSEKVILEVREGAKIIPQVKIEVQNRPKSPQKKVQDKKFMKFEPKKIGKTESTATLANIFKSNPNS